MVLLFTQVGSRGGEEVSLITESDFSVGHAKHVRCLVDSYLTGIRAGPNFYISPDLLGPYQALGHLLNGKPTLLSL